MKKLKKRNLFLLVVGIIFLALLLSSPFLHNHHSFQESKKCLANLIQTSLISALAFFAYLKLLTNFARERLFSRSARPIYLNRHFSSLIRRAPPA